MITADEDREERGRVFSKIAPLILAYAHNHAGQSFHAEELRRFVLQLAPEIAPDSPGRILRELRLRGQLDYVVLNRRQSLYQFRTRVREEEEEHKFKFEEFFEQQS